VAVPAKFGRRHVRLWHLADIDFDAHMCAFGGKADIRDRLADVC
jgi:hypothetical protein